MARIKNPVIVSCAQQTNSTLTIATSMSSPVAIYEYLNAVIAEMPELSVGKYYALNRKDWASGSQYKMCMFNISNGSVKTDTAIRSNISGDLSARSFSSTSLLSVAAGDTFEFIKVDTQ